MRRLYQFIGAIVAFGLSLITPVFAQLKADSVTMGAEYANDIFYSLENGEVQSVDRDNWDIGFYTSTWSAGIITNEGNGVELRLYPNADTTGWDNIDTTGLSTWPVLYNSPDLWEDGAFNRSAKNHPDYGWGVYNTINHDVVGDSIYILSFVEGSPKKIWIQRKISTQNTFIFKYADLDGSNEVNETVVCSDYTDKNFLYYSLQTQEVLDREPASDSWDLLFTKYIAMLDGNVPYPVTGVLVNEDVPANRFDEVGADFDDWSSMPFDSTKVPIGYDWKYFVTGIFNYVVKDSIAFFVSNRNTDVYKLVFKGFDFMVGHFVFEKGLVSPAGFGEVRERDQVRVFPNPASDNITLEMKPGVTPDAVTILDLAGRTVFSSRDLNRVTTFNVSGLPAGMYVIRVQDGREQYVQKLMINRN